MRSFDCVFGMVLDSGLVVTVNHYIHFDRCRRRLRLLAGCTAEGHNAVFVFPDFLPDFRVLCGLLVESVPVSGSGWQEQDLDQGLPVSGIAVHFMTHDPKP